MVNRLGGRSLCYVRHAEFDVLVRYSWKIPGVGRAGGKGEWLIVEAPAGLWGGDLSVWGPRDGLGRRRGPRGEPCRMAVRRSTRDRLGHKETRSGRVGEDLELSVPGRWALRG